MKKTLFCAVFLPMALQAQVGINTNDPKATLEVKKNTHIPNTQPQGVLFPRFTSEERLKFSGTAEVGTMIYNTDKSCIEIYQGVVSGVHQWTCMPGSNQTQSVAVTAAGFEGSYVGGVAFTSANKAKFKLENNSFGNISSAFHDAVSFQNGGATITMTNCQWQKLNGATLTGSVNPCTSGSLINLNSGESAMLWYTMGGTPETGTLKANFNKLGAQADQQTQVGLGSATITSPKTEYVVSLTYNGSNIQGKINNGTNKLTVKIPYTSGIGSYQAVQSAVIPAAPGEGGDNNGLSLSIPAGNFGVSGDLSATIAVDGDGEYLVKKLAPGQEYTIATIPYTLNGNNYEVVLKGIGGILDKKFNVPTNGVLEHQFIYVPVTITGTYPVNGQPYQKEWLNLNLGADYANVNSPHFNPAQQGTSATDHHAYGSLFQWGRDADGHELINWSSSSYGTPVYNLGWWTESQLTSYNDPCPTGWHAPSGNELYDLLRALTNWNGGSYDSAGLWEGSNFRMPSNGYRTSMNGEVFGAGSGTGSLWSGWVWRVYADRVSGLRVSGPNRHEYRLLDGGGWLVSYGYGVRCIKDN
ncbi:hypothetical protein PG275_07440 [Riemerella anatipestifer]|uniref:hypothetical protein n=1 Tax=Riemerella anatipestifer TaxID=34085 RepID=UPI002A8B0D37|nr:hypothetical protein [Riemerella anatipestifer]